MNLLRNRLFIAVVSGHFAVDVLNSVVPVLLATLAVPLALTNAQIGTALTIQIFAGALSQPLFGWLADIFRGRPAILAGIGVAWMAFCLAGVALSHNWMLITLLIGLMSLGSGLFHPVGTAGASAASPERAASATAMFFFWGQVGLALGPVLGGQLLGAQSYSSAILLICAVALVPVALLFTAPPAPPVITQKRGQVSALHTTATILVAFIVLVALRSSIQSAYMSFLPKLFADQGWEPAAYGAIAGIFMLAAAIGNVIAGDIADRFGMRAATLWPSLLSVPAGLLCLWSPTPLAAFVGSAVAGMLVGGQHSVLVVHAQRLLPVKQGFAAGLILGFTFASGGLGTWLAGLAADYTGLLAAMQGITLLGLPVALLALTLPGPEARPVEVAQAQV